MLALGAFPTHLAADAWYVYQATVRHGGIAAVPLNQHSARSGGRELDGVPRCHKGLRMVPRFFFQPPNGYRAQRWNVSLIRNFMICIGPISSIFDFLTFFIMLARSASRSLSRRWLLHLASPRCHCSTSSSSSA